MASDSRKKALDRAAKLLARAASDNPNEAALARSNFEAACRKHGFTREDVEEHVDAGARAFEDAGPLVDDFWQIRLALAVADRVGVRATRKSDRLFFEGSPRRARRAATAYAIAAGRLLPACEGVYASYGHPPVFRPVLLPILLEEAARAIAERLLGREQPRRFPVPREVQEELLLWSRVRTRSEGLARMHVEWARRGGRAVGLALEIPDRA